MKALEFTSSLSPGGALLVPDDVARSIPSGKAVRVLILVAEDETGEAWEQLAATELGSGYAESDAIYDQLSAG